MDFLNRLRQLAAVVGQRQEHQAPMRNQKLLSLALSETAQTAHYILDGKLAKAILTDPQHFAQDSFLLDLLAACPQEDISWIRLFVERSPEFLDGQQHDQARKGLAIHFQRLQKAAHDSRCQGTLALENCDAAISSRSLAEIVVYDFYSAMLSDWLEHPVYIESSLLFAPDIFTPTLRLKSSLLAVNAALDRFIADEVPESFSQDESATLALLSLFLMAVSPLVSALTCLFNAVANAKTWSDLDQACFRSFAMIPTNFVARKCASDRTVDGYDFKANDTVYVMLFESSGCPFSALSVLPFGKGRHHCAGSGIAKEIMDAAIGATRLHFAVIKQHLRPSALATGHPAAFLKYEA